MTLSTWERRTEWRLVAAALMIAGVALIGAVTASLASWFIGRVRTPSPDTEILRLSALLGQLPADVEGADAPTVSRPGQIA